MFKRLTTRLGASETPPPWGMAAAIAASVASFAAMIFGASITLTLFCGLPANAAYCQAANFQLPPAVLFIGWGIGVSMTIAFIRFTRNRLAERAALRLQATTTPLFFLLFIGVGLAITLDIVSRVVTGLRFPNLELLGLYQQIALFRQPVDALTWLLAGVFMVLGQPVAEELVFRGVALPALRTALGAWPGLVASTILYTVFHLAVYPPQTADTLGLWHGLAAPFISGLIFTSVRLYTGSTRAAIVTHAAFSLFALANLLTISA
jgi:membrane protease YdiL (CAAX protease family)